MKGLGEMNSMIGVGEKPDSDKALKNGPELWDAILKEMNPGAVIAGGAVRDYLLDVEPKDIDVFMGNPVVPPVSSDPNDLSFLEYRDPRNQLFRIDDRYERMEEYAAVSNITVVSSGTMFGYKVDAIEIEDFDPATLLDGFDFSINRSMYFDQAIIDTEEARNDRERGTVTLKLGDRMERSEKRFSRFNERMGGRYRFIRGDL